MNRVTLTREKIECLNTGIEEAYDVVKKEWKALEDQYAIDRKAMEEEKDIAHRWCEGVDLDNKLKKLLEPKDKMVTETVTPKPLLGIFKQKPYEKRVIERVVPTVKGFERGLDKILSEVDEKPPCEVDTEFRSSGGGLAYASVDLYRAMLEVVRIIIEITVDRPGRGAYFEGGGTPIRTHRYISGYVQPPEWPHKYTQQDFEDILTELEGMLESECAVSVDPLWVVKVKSIIDNKAMSDDHVKRLANEVDMNVSGSVSHHHSGYIGGGHRSSSSVSFVDTGLF